MKFRVSLIVYFLGKENSLFSEKQSEP